MDRRVMIKALNNAFERRNKRQEENAKFAREMAKEAFKNKLLIQREEAKARMQQGILPSAESEAGLKTRQESMIKSPEMQFEMPAEKVGRTSTGRPVAKQTTEADKQMSFMNAYQRVISQGKTPPSWATKVFEKYKAKQNQRMTGKEAQENEVKKLKEQLSFLKSVEFDNTIPDFENKKTAIQERLQDLLGLGAEEEPQKDMDLQEEEDIEGLPSPEGLEGKIIRSQKGNKRLKAVKGKWQRI